MRHFEFELQIPDGTVLTVPVDAFTWPDGFSRACQRVEKRNGLAPSSGIICRTYRSSPRPEPAGLALAA
jgi:hypothetical protein